MSEDKERVSFVQYFSSAELIDSAIGPSHKSEESVAKFLRFCEEELRRTYPNAEIKVAYSESMQTLVHTWNGFEESEDIEEAMWVDQICERIYKKFDWLVYEELISVARSSIYVNSHPAVVRWACANSLINGSRKPDGLWSIPLEALRKVKDTIELVASENFIWEAGQKKQMVACYFETVKDLFLIELPEEVEVLIITQSDFGNSLFKPNTSYVLLSKNNDQIHISVEHFVDVVAWSQSDLRWSYSAYAKALIAQATRLGIEGSWKINEQNGSDVIDGVSFHFVENLNQDTTLQILLGKVLPKLSNLIDAAKLSLKGGLIWDDVNDAIYQKDELRFSKELLEPLLHYMGFDLVRNTHGNRGEHGRDFVCAYQTPFNQPIYFGLQVKRGSISGNAKSQIASTLKQIEDAFLVAYTKEPGSSETKIYISCMILAISGEFKDDAQSKIYARVPKHEFPVGSLFLWDKPIIKSFISKLFPPNTEE